MIDPRKLPIVLLWISCLSGTQEGRHNSTCCTAVPIVQALIVSPTVHRNYAPSKFQSKASSLLRKGSRGIAHDSISSLRDGANGTAADGDEKDILDFLSSARNFANKNFFLVGMFVAVILAKALPALGKNGGILRPELFIGNFGVTMIFFLSGVALPTSEMAQAISNVKMNCLIQALIFAVWPVCIGVPLKFLLATISPRLSDGILIMTTLPTTVNMCIMLTSASGGNAAVSICNAVISNMLGIFITPLWLFQFFGATIQLPFGSMVLKLCQKVLLPVTVGQLLRATGAKKVYQKYSNTFKRLQEVVLLGIVWNAFCNAFESDGLGIGTKESLLLLLLLPNLHLASLGACFKLFSLPVLGFSKTDVVAAMFCASQKTLAFGLPLVNTIFHGNPNLAAFCAPIMFLHPLQMMIGSLLLPTLQKYTQGNDARMQEDC
jgi:solute carrier family 10 (sodium/bile acid cotransporter), member 7